MFFAGALSLGLRPKRLPIWVLWAAALIALDAALLGSWLYGGYTQALGRMLVDVELAGLHQIEQAAHGDLSERRSGLLDQAATPLSAPAKRTLSADE
jgi:hypothetical protein